jgi:hypothetical protein
MTGIATKRRIGWGAAFIAAYALVFNVILSSILMASVSPSAAADAHELCISDINPDALANDAGKSGGKMLVHCPLCVGHHVAVDLPPPPAALIGRIPLRAEIVHSFQEHIFARIRTFANLSRGPPVLI